MKLKNIKIYKLLNPQKNTFFKNFAPEYVAILPSYTASIDSDTKELSISFLNIYGYSTEYKNYLDMIYVYENDKRDDTISLLFNSLRICKAQEVDLIELPLEFYNKIKPVLLKASLIKFPNVFELLGDL